MSSDWGPPGLETPPSPYGKRQLAAGAVALAFSIGIPWCYEHVGSIDLMTGKRSCGAAPSEIRVWSFHGHTRRPEEAVNLQKWIARHPGRINRHYGAFCNTALHFAAEFGREDLADLLVAGGADVEATNGLGERPLHVSATYGHPAVARLLLARGADAGARARGGKTPLHDATCGRGQPLDVGGRIVVAKLLLAAGADVNARLIGSGFMPLRCATMYESRNAAMADLLLSHGADPRGAGVE